MTMKKEGNSLQDTVGGFLRRIQGQDESVPPLRAVPTLAVNMFSLSFADGNV